MSDPTAERFNEYARWQSGNNPNNARVHARIAAAKAANEEVAPEPVDESKETDAEADEQKAKTAPKPLNPPTWKPKA